MDMESHEGISLFIGFTYNGWLRSERLNLESLEVFGKAGKEKDLRI